MPILLHEDTLLIFFLLEFFPVISWEQSNFIFSFLFHMNVHLLQDHLLPSALCPLLHNQVSYMDRSFAGFCSLPILYCLSLCQCHHLNSNSFRTSLDIQQCGSSQLCSFSSKVSQLLVALFPYRFLEPVGQFLLFFPFTVRYN